MTSYKIRKATQDDTTRIIVLTQENSVTRNSLTPGFLEFPILTEQEYRARLASSPFCYAATSETLVGFLLAYQRRSLEQGLVSGPIAEHILLCERNCVYLDQAAVMQEQRRKGIARALFDRCLSDASDAGHEVAYGATSHTPLRNAAMINLLLDHSFSLVDIIAFDGLTFGLYEKKLT